MLSYSRVQVIAGLQMTDDGNAKERQEPLTYLQLKAENERLKAEQDAWSKPAVRWRKMRKAVAGLMANGRSSSISLYVETYCRAIGHVLEAIDEVAASDIRSEVDLDTENRRLHDEVERLKADERRLDWLVQHSSEIKWIGKNIRDAIDAAIQKESSQSAPIPTSSRPPKPEPA